MSEVELHADYAQPADMTRVYTVIRIAIGAVALALAVWLAFENDATYRRWADTIFQARLEARAATEERDRAVAERNAAIAELEDLRAGKAVEGLSGASLTRVDGYLAEIEKRTQALREASLKPEATISDYVLPELGTIQKTAAEAREYLKAGAGPLPGESPLRGAVPPRGGVPELKPSNWIPDEAPARLIPASLNAAVAPPPVEPVPALAAQTRLYVVLGMLGLLGLTFLIAVVAVFTTRSARVNAFATDTIKTLLGFFIGVVTAFMGAPA